MSAMNERLQRLMPSASRTKVSLQILALAGAYMVCRELSTILRLKPGSDAVRQCEP